MINKGTKGNYYSSEKKVCAPFVRVPKGCFIPVNGLVAYPVGDFSNYQLLGSFDFIKDMQTIKLREKCSIQ